MTTTPELSLVEIDVPAGLRYEVPMSSRAIAVEDVPELRPVLARASAGGFFERAREGRRAGAARSTLLSAQMRTSSDMGAAS